MSTALSTVIAEIMPDVMGCPYPMVEQELRKLLQDFCKETQIVNRMFKKSVLSTDPASPNDHIDITTPTEFANWQPCAIMRLTIDGIDYDTQERRVDDDLADITDIVPVGEKWWYLSTATNIVMYPFDSVAAELGIKVAFAPTMSVTTLDDVFYQDWHIALVAGVKARLMAMPKKAWSNPNLVPYYHDLYSSDRASAMIATINNTDRTVKQRLSSQQL